MSVCLFGFFNMKRSEYCALIKFFAFDDLTQVEIHLNLLKVHMDASLSPSTVKKWTALFKFGSICLKGDSYEGLSKMLQHYTSFNKLVIWYCMVNE